MTFDGGGGGQVWVTSGKNISCRLISREGNSFKEIPGYLPTLNKSSLHCL